MTAAEEWTFVPGWPEYQVSRRGAVRRAGRVLKPEAIGGYHRYFLHRADRRAKIMAHRLVLEAFVGPCPDGLVCCHNNGVRDDNRVENLRWDTHQANADDTLIHGTRFSPRRKRGREHHNCKVAAPERVNIRILLALGAGASDVARWFSITSTHVYRVRDAVEMRT